MFQRMEFPDDWHDFLKEYKFPDVEHAYTDGYELIPIFRVEQMVAHYFLSKQEDK